MRKINENYDSTTSSRVLRFLYFLGMEKLRRKRNTGHQSHKPYGTSASNWVLERKLVQPLRGTSQDMTLVEEMVYQLSQAFPQTPNFSFGFANVE